MSWVEETYNEHWCDDCTHVRTRRKWTGAWKECPSCKGTGGESVMGHNDSVWFPCHCHYGKVPDEALSDGNSLKEER